MATGGPVCVRNCSDKGAFSHFLSWGFFLLLIDPEKCDRYVVPKRRQQTTNRHLKTSHIPCFLVPKLRLSLVVLQCSGFGTRSPNWRINSTPYWSAVALCPTHLNTFTHTHTHTHTYTHTHTHTYTHTYIYIYI